MFGSAGPSRLIGAAALGLAVLASVATALVPLQQRALAPTPIEAVVPVVVTVAAVVLYAAHQSLASLCLASAATTWALVGLAVYLPSPLELPVLRLGLVPLALLVVAALSVPTGELRDPLSRSLAILAGVVAVLAGAGVGVPALALLGSLLFAGALSGFRMNSATAVQIVLAVALIGLEADLSSWFVSPRLAADGVSVLLMAGAVAIALILDRPLDVNDSEGLNTSAQFGRRLGAALGASGEVRVCFPLGANVFVDVEGHECLPPEQSVPVVIEGDDPVAIIGGVDAIEPALRRSLGMLLTKTAGLARLRRDLHVQTGLLAASRHRLVTAADQERSRIGAQLERSVLARLDGVSVDLQGLDDAGKLPDRLAATRQELARFATGLDPLAGGPLADAVEAIGERSELVSTRVDLPFEPDLATARAAWFVASEAITNALKHAPAASVVLEAWSDASTLTLRITDSGPGGVQAELTSIRDRVRASGGVFHVESTANGTAVSVDFPLASEQIDTYSPLRRSRAVPDPQEDHPFLGSVV